MRTRFGAAFLVVIFAVSHTFVQALQSAPQVSLVAQVDQLFSEWDHPISPGGALAIIKDNEVIYSRGYGIANLDYGIPISSSSVFYIGSVSKQFAAACIALLLQEGSLSLDDDIRQYFPEMPDYGTPIRIRHLIHHTSGLRDFWGLVGLSGQRFDNVYTNADVLEIVTRQRGVNFKPGERYLYSNTNYLLMAMIVQRVSGQSLRDFADERIFKPLGMRQTLFNDDHTTIVQNRVSGYAPREAGGYRMSIVNNDLVGQGGLWTTVEDLAKWDRNFYTAKVGGTAFIERMLTTGALNNGEALRYAYGLNVTEYRGQRMVTHSGAMGGYRSVLTRFPEQRFSVIILANLATMRPSALALKVADLYLFGGPEETLAINVETAPEITLTSRELRKLAGLYQNADGGIMRITTAEGILSAQVFGSEYATVALSPTHFRLLESRSNIEIMFEQSSRSRSMRIIRNDRSDDTYNKIKVVAPAARDLPGYTGDYYSAELQYTFQIALEDGELIFTQGNAPDAVFEPLTRDAFRVGGWRIEIRRDKRKRITGFILDAGRVRHIEFVRQPG